MKKGLFKTMVALLGVPMVGATLTACGPSQTEKEASYSEIKITETSKQQLTAEWRVGQADRTIVVTLKDDKGANVPALMAGKDITVTSSNPSAVKVSTADKFKLQAVGEGTAKITVKAGNAKDEIELTVLAAKHGSLITDPLSVPEAVAIAKELSHDTSTEDKYYISGIVKSVTEAYTSQYKNVTLTLIAPGGESTDIFTLYRIGVEEGITDPATSIVAGKKVLAYAQIKKYNTTYETNAGSIVKVEDYVNHTTAITLSTESLDLEVEQEAVITATLTPLDATDALSFTSGNEAVATVDANGKVKGIGAGSTSITVTSGSITKTVAVTVTVADPNGLKELAPVALTEGESIGLSTTAPSESSTKVYSQKIPGSEEQAKMNFVGKWGLSTKYDALYANDGADYVWGQYEGYYIHKLIVNARKYVNLTVYGNKEGTGDPIPYRVISGTVDNTGSGGSDVGTEEVFLEFVINAKEWCLKANQKSSSIHSIQVCIENKAMEVSGVSLDKDSATISTGGTVQLNATVLPRNTTGTIVWSSEDTGVCTVANGVVAGVAAGQTTVKATIEGTTFSAECAVEVIEGAIHATELSINAAKTSLIIGEPTKITYAFEAGKEECEDTVSWVSSDTTKATVTADADGNCIVNTLGVGEVTITAQTSEYVDDTSTAGLKKSVVLTIADADLKSVADMYGDNAAKNKVVSLDAYYICSYDANLYTGIFVGVGDKAVEIYKSGLKALPEGYNEEGKALHITGKYDVYNECVEIIDSSIVVIDAPVSLAKPTALTVNDDASFGALKVGDLNRPITATGFAKSVSATNVVLDVDGNDLTVYCHASATTKEQRDAFATIAVGEKVTVSGALGYNSSKFQVVNPVIVEKTNTDLYGISLSKSKLTLAPTETEKLTASLLPATCSGTIVWASDAESVATVDQEGNITAVANGTANITATISGKTATCVVTVGEVDYSGDNALSFTPSATYTPATGDNIAEKLQFANIFTVSVDKCDASTAVAFYTDGVRLYNKANSSNGGYINIAVSSDYVITKVVVNYATADKVGGFCAINGTTQEAIAKDHASDTVVFQTGVNAVKLQNVSTASSTQVRISGIVLTLAKAA